MIASGLSSTLLLGLLASAGALPGGAPSAGLPVVDFVLPDSSAGEGAGSVLVEVQLSAPLAVDLDVPVQLDPTGTATSPEDGQLLSPVTIPAGELGAQVEVQLVDDGLDELDETFVLLLGTPTGADLGAQVQHVLTVSDDDDAPTAAFVEQRHQTLESSGSYALELQLSAPSGLAVTIDLDLQGSATRDVDYSAPDSVVVPAGETTGSVDITLLQDSLPEDSEVVIVRMTQASNAELDPTMRRAGLLLLDDDSGGSNPPTRGLQVSPTVLEFPVTRATESSGPVELLVRNQNVVPVTFKRLTRHGDDRDDLVVSYDAPTPVLLQPGETVTARVEFSPQFAGPKEALLRVQQEPQGFPVTEVPLLARALGPPGEELYLNASVVPYTDGEGVVWLPDHGLTGSSTTVGGTSFVAGTSDQQLYKSARIGPAFGYQLQVPSGTYELTLLFAELLVQDPGERVFDILAEGQPLVSGLDLVAEAGFSTAYQVEAMVEVQDGQLDLELQGTVGEAILSALALGSVPVVDMSPLALDFLTVEQGSFDQLDFLVSNDGLVDAVIEDLGLVVQLGSGLDFRVEVAGQTFQGAPQTISYPTSIVVPAGGEVPFTITFEPTAHAEHRVALRLDGEWGTLEGTIEATGGASAGWGFLHPELFAEPQLVVDYDQDGSEVVSLYGSSSHTHEQGRSIVGHSWTSSSGGSPPQVFSSEANTALTVGQGETLIGLEISDDSSPVAQTAADELTVTVHSPDAVPGLLARYHSAPAGGAGALLDAVPAVPDFMERRDSLTLLPEQGRVGGSPYTGDVLVTLTCAFEAPVAADHEFTVSGGSDSRLLVDGALSSGAGSFSYPLAAGTHQLEVRFAVDQLTDLPLSLEVAIDGVAEPGFAAELSYDAIGLPPIVHAMEDVGSELGGNLITIEGFGFFPRDEVVVHWGDLIEFRDGDPDHPLLSSGDSMLQLYSPPGLEALGNGASVGLIQVTVETPAGTTAPREFLYSGDGPAPILFTYDDDKKVIVEEPTCLEWGPDGRLYVGTISGHLHAVTYDDENRPIDVQTFTGVSGLVNSDLTGITFNPYDPVSPVRVYVSHSQHYEHGGAPPLSASTYSGQVSVLTGPAFDTPEPLITGLPVSNLDHGVNGLFFDNEGNLLLCVGGTTNAGVSHPSFGGLPESPFSGAILRAFTSRPDFNGAIEYVLRDDPLTVQNDQRFGEDVVPAAGIDIEVFAHGLRNPYDLALASSGFLYATDNGPNQFGSGLGPASTGPDSDTGISPDSDDDEVVLVRPGSYYGHPNRARGKDDPRQYIFRNHLEPSIPGEFTQNIGTYRSSVDGIAEYRATTFGGAMRGNLILQRYGQRMVRGVLDEDGLQLEAVVEDLPYLAGLDATPGPGGTLYSISYILNRVRMLEPEDAAAVGLTAYEIMPWRATSTGGQPFVIGGSGFGDLGNTSVRIAGIQAQLTSVSPTRIRGLVPPNPGWTPQLEDVVVQVSSSSTSIPGIFRYLPPTPSPQPGFWTTGSSMPDALGEVACAVVDGILYCWGEGSGKTYAYDIAQDSWSDGGALRPYPGNHHGCEVIDGKIYLVGGLGAGGGKVQIYDPALDAWSLGADMPWAGGSVTTCVLGGRIHAAGGIVGSNTVRNHARYDPVDDSWTPLALLSDPLKVNHAAASTDGERFWIFGGRGGPNVPQPGYEQVQVYDPATDSWETSDDVGTLLQPMPGGGRGGTGRAVFFQGEFLVFGGETSNNDSNPDATPNKVFPQVFVYDPQTHGWREDAEMLTPRHGIFPVAYQGRILVAGGGTKNGFSASDVLEIFQR